MGESVSVGCAVGIGVVGSKVGWFDVGVGAVVFTGSVNDTEPVDSHSQPGGTFPPSGSLAAQSSSH